MQSGHHHPTRKSALGTPVIGSAVHRVITKKTNRLTVAKIRIMIVFSRGLILGLLLLCLFSNLLCQAQSAQPKRSASSSDIQQLFAAGETALRAGDLTTAERDFARVVEQDPQVAGAYANLLQHAERLAPSVAGIRLNIGLVYFRQNNFAAAVAPFASVVKEQPESSQARYLLGLCYFFTQKPAEAVDTLEPLWAEQWRPRFWRRTGNLIKPSPNCRPLRR